VSCGAAAGEVAEVYGPLQDRDVRGTDELREAHASRSRCPGSEKLTFLAAKRGVALA
jgi:hypothetical protein